MKLRLGVKPSSAWIGTGFETSFKIARDADGIRERIRLLNTYLQNFPESQVAQFELTATKAAALVQVITAAQNAVNVQLATVGTLLTIRRTKQKAMQRRISGLTEELGRLIDPLDARWLSFGLNRPGAKETPEIPQNVTIAPMGDEAATVGWEASPRAEYYRVWLKMEGVDQEPRVVGTPSDLDFMLEQLPRRAAIEVSISAVNDGGESRRSATVSLINRESA